MKLSTVVQSHPGRRSHAKRLASELRAPIMVDDPDGPINPWRCYQRCLRHQPPTHAGFSHRLIVQDDAVLCADFLRHAQEAISRAPECPIIFSLTVYATLTARRVREARDAGRAWCDLHPAEPWVPVVCTAWPRWCVESILAFAGGITRPMADDAMIADWRAAHQPLILVTCPNLAEHDDSLPSVANPARQHWQDRRSPWWEPDPVIDWDAGLPAWA